MTAAHVDVLIIGAGISGIGAACHLTREAPHKSYTILERRHAIGGTWDLFRYPGIRSDSDMSTFGFNFRPWTERKVLADGASIRAYVEATADEYRVRERIRFGSHVLDASWSSADSRWTVRATDEASGEIESYTCSFLLGATGYYDYDAGYRPEFPGEQDFAGPVVHPQHWPEDLDYAGKKVVVIGSGATAVTLVPAMAPDAGHVTMLQRSPTYIVSLPAVDKIAAAMRKFLPEMAVYRLSRIRNIGIQRASYSFSRRFPGTMRKIVVGGVRRQLGPDADLRHFTPSYDPWDQRLCVVPNGDLFRVIRDGKADVVTDTIERFTATGIRLTSGVELDADVIVAATGLQIQMLGGAQLIVDGEPVRLNELLTYKGVLIENVPNAAMIFGYTNASWTLKADIAAEYAIRLMKHMDGSGYRQVVARAQPGDHGTESLLGSLDSGYVRRGNPYMPRQGTRAPWIVLNNYLRDAPALRRARFDDGALEFSRSRPTLVRSSTRRHEPA
ncbi:NAD(P)/FAD-dependent oxidoreductase [Jatrophihabitans sp.]|uniref:flavin-containing monooxygenase n=1 Tax=Jatrophihabitans sp. TaxID=1932789 RepID=UPI0030C6D72C|nr:NAD(P)/FAD-dependent oxidoreductase [Jatrophihabitans sp.]